MAVKHSTTPSTPNQRGSTSEGLVKKNLWRRNYRVKDVSRLSVGYDLLVEERYRVEVKSMDGNLSTIGPIMPDKFDVLCLVVLTSMDGGIIFYLRDKAFIKKYRLTTPSGGFKITPDILRAYFTKKPHEVFAKAEEK